MKEMDIILGRFAAVYLADLSDELVDQFERLLACPDQNIYGWISGNIEVPDDFDNEIMSLIRNFDVSSEEVR